MKRILSLILMLFWLAMAIPAAADVVVGLPADSSNGNMYPFGTAYVGEYQQVYNSSEFGGTITITDLEFFNTSFNSAATSTPTGTWTISLSTTSADWNTLSNTYSNNLGTNNTEVFSGSINQSWTFGDTLTIDLTTPFTYDPTQGNLLMDVFVSDASATTGNLIYFDTNGNYSPDSIMGRVYNPGVDVHSTGNVDSGYGLVTGFSTSPVPEPSTMLLLGFGLIGLAGIARKKMKA